MGLMNDHDNAVRLLVDEDVLKVSGWMSSMHKYLQPQDKDKGHVWPGDKGHAS